jgi:hypothetical protein
MLFSGSPIKVGGGTIFGYLNHPDRNTVDMATPWDQVTNLEDVVDDVLAMTTAARAARYYGPYVLYIPAAYESVLDIGSLLRKFKVMAAWAPRVKADFDGRSGIVHLSPISS